MCAAEGGTEVSRCCSRRCKRRRGRSSPGCRWRRRCSPAPSSGGWSSPSGGSRTGGSPPSTAGTAEEGGGVGGRRSKRRRRRSRGQRNIYRSAAGGRRSATQRRSLSIFLLLRFGRAGQLLDSSSPPVGSERAPILWDGLGCTRQSQYMFVL